MVSKILLPRQRERRMQRMRPGCLLRKMQYLVVIVVVLMSTDMMVQYVVHGGKYGNVQTHKNHFTISFHLSSFA